jgi:hypothetical protein
MKALLLPLILISGLFSIPLNAQTAKKAPVSRSLDAMITGDQLWETTTDAFEAKFKPLGLQWLSEKKDQARFFGSGFNLFEDSIPVLEAVADFQDGKLARANLSLYNRGDSKVDPKNVAEFEALVNKLRDTISTRIGAKAVDRGKDATSAVKAMGYLWNVASTAYLLEYSYQKEMKSMNKEFRAEFIRLRVAPLPKQTLLGGNTNTGNKPVAKASLVTHVTKDTNGDIVIKDVPMVDQGPKGYCVVATAERVFKYLGLSVDQHEMAAIANSSASGGTSPDEMVGALKTLTGRLKVHIRELQGWNYGEFQRMIGDYNRSAKKNKKREINLDGMKVINIGDIYASFDPDSLKESRASQGKAAFSKFQREVAAAINRGVPIMWSVELGIYKEGDLPQSHGGHMRLIIGYNTKTNELLYSDSWGAEHALKRMAMDNACAMTTGMYYLEPIQ